MSTFSEYRSQLDAVPNLAFTAVCQCGRDRPVEDLYFCPEPGYQEFVCKTCTEQIIDTYYCPSCLNSFFSSSAFDNKNRCTQCLACPRCTTTLDATQEGSVCVFQCGFCHWDSTIVNLSAADPPALFQALRERTSGGEQALKFNQLTSHFAEKKKAAARLLTEAELIGAGPDKVEITNDYKAAAKALDLRLEERNRALWRLPAEPVDNAHLQPYVDSGFDVTTVSSMEQRNAHPGLLSPDTSMSLPLGVYLNTKLGHRHPKCQKWVVKPKAGATKVTFDVLHVAQSYVPTITVMPFDTLEKGKATKITLVFRNPCESLINLSLSQVPDSVEEEEEEEGVTRPNIRKQAGSAKIEVAEGVIPMDPYDEIAFLHEAFTQEPEEKAEPHQDDAAVIAMRKLHRIGVFATVTPEQDEGDVTCSFLVQLTSEETPEAQEAVGFSKFRYQVNMNLGPVGFAAE